MELDIFWSGYDGVMATLIDAPQLHEIPVVFFTEIYKQLPPEVFPRVIARLRSPFQSQELFRLRKLLDNMECAHVVDLLSRQQTSQLTAKRGSSILAKTEGGGIRHATFKAPSIFTDHR